MIQKVVVIYNKLNKKIKKKLNKMNKSVKLY